MFMLRRPRPRGSVARNKIVTELAVAGAMLLVGWVAMYAAFGTPYPFYVVASGSMVPALEVNDILLVQGHDPIEAVEVGDIIVFDRPDGAEKVIVHRVVEVISDDPRTLRTRGDANQISIPGTDFPITEDKYIGKVMHIVPKVGYVTKALAPPVNYVLIAIIIGFMVFKHVRASRRPSVPAPDRDMGDLDAVPRDGEYSAGAGAQGAPGASGAARGPQGDPGAPRFPGGGGPPPDGGTAPRAASLPGGPQEPQGEGGMRPPGDGGGGTPRAAGFSDDVWVPAPPGAERPPGGAAAPPGAPPPARPDHYAALGLPRTASTPDIRERYTRLAAEHAGNGEMIDRITRAYGVLSDPERRRRYDCGDASP